MNIAYILISTPNDTFYEQTAISVMTLRKVMPDANVYILVDKDTDLGRRIFDCENGDYIYFAVPDDLHLTYDFFSNGMKDGNWVYEVRNLTNQYGYVKPYRIYHTGNILHGYNIYIEVESHDWY